MQQPFSVRLSITDGPVKLRNGGAGVSATFDVWDGITASEYFPTATEQAFYRLAVEKPITQPEDVPQIENELTSTLLRIAETWSFSGGSDMLIKTRGVITSSKFESNAAEVKRLLLDAQGRREIRRTIPLPLEILAKYSQAPLSVAVQIAQFAKVHFATSQLLTYYHEARVNRGFMNEPGWFVNLYKVRDTIHKIYVEKAKKNKVTKTKPYVCSELKALGVDMDEWKRFGSILNNNDFRHAEITGVSPPVPRNNVDMCYDAARKWVLLYLRSKNLPVVQK
jgi:hypothetical protein